MDDIDEIVEVFNQRKVEARELGWKQMGEDC